MLNDVNTVSAVRSRIGCPQIRIAAKARKDRKPIAYVYRWHLLLWITIGGLSFLLLGIVVQYADPTVGWLDAGTLSLPLFAAWSCMLGYGIAGLLPAMISLIGRKGGIKLWKPTMQSAGMLIAYLGYIAVLCALL